MNFLNLHYFMVCAEELNFTRAAKRLFISQQSLSNHIKKLEDEYGVLLFNRGTHVTLTEAGSCLYRNARDLVRLQKKTERELLDIRDFRRGEITVGISMVRGAAMLPAILSEYRGQFPQVRVHIYEGGNADLMEVLQKGRVDLVIGFEAHEEAVQSDFLFVEEQYLVVPDGILQQCFSPEEQAQLLQKKSHPLEAFSRCPFVVMPSNTWTGGVFDENQNHARISVNSSISSVSTTTMLALVRAGLGACICSRTCLRADMEQLGGSLNFFKLEGPMNQTNIAISTRKNSYLTRAAREFIHVTHQLYGSAPQAVTPE